MIHTEFAWNCLILINASDEETLETKTLVQNTVDQTSSAQHEKYVKTLVSGEQNEEHHENYLIKIVLVLIMDNKSSPDLFMRIQVILQVVMDCDRLFQPQLLGIKVTIGPQNSNKREKVSKPDPLKLAVVLFWLF